MPVLLLFITVWSLIGLTEVSPRTVPLAEVTDLLPESTENPGVAAELIGLGVVLVDEETAAFRAWGPLSRPRISTFPHPII